MSLTMTDLFAGGGGSSFGASLVSCISVVMAANHWPLAVEVHQENHPGADHDTADISQVDPRRYPNTDILWASPSCTKHSIAQGRKYDPEDVTAERSRATMWDPLRFCEFHRYRFIFVENVVDVLKWPFMRAWRIGWDDLGYCVHEVFLNAAHAGQLGDPAAQSRDRWFALIHPKGTACPDIERYTCPQAWCPNCEATRFTYQAWKRPDVQAGKYRAQYLYRCRICKTVCEPAVRPAADIINWALPAQLIGERKVPLAEKTMRRILTGFVRYGSALVPVEGRDGKQPLSVERPMRTCTGRNETGLLVPPFIAELRGGHSKTRRTSDPLATVTAGGNHHGLVLPYYRTGVAKPTSQPLPTVTTVDRAGLVQSPVAQFGSLTELLESVHRRKSRALQHLLDNCGFRMLTPDEYAAAMEFPGDYRWRGSKRDRVRMAGQAVPTNMARDLVACGVESMQVPVEVAA